MSVADGTTPQTEGVQSLLSEFAGPLVSDMLGKSWALSNENYQSYDGMLTPGFTTNQQDAFSGIAGLTVPSGGFYQNGGAYDANAINTDQWNNQFAQQYMNPYVQSALNPSMDEARRQAEISRINNAGRMAKAGSFGGGRQAIMDSENDRNLMFTQNKMLQEGYRDAYDTGMKGFMQDQGRQLEADMGTEKFRAIEGDQNLQEAADAARYGIAGLDAEQGIYDQMLKAGEIERNANKEAVAADYAQFQQERDHPYKQLQFLQSMLSGIPIEARDTTFQDPNQLATILGASGSIIDLLREMFPGEG